MRGISQGCLSSLVEDMTRPESLCDVKMALTPAFGLSFTSGVLEAPQLRSGGQSTGLGRGRYGARPSPPAQTWVRVPLGYAGLASS